ncbi:RICIN domain-containing protein [Streptomyces sp. NPDC020801]
MIRNSKGSRRSLVRRGLHACGAVLLALIALITLSGTSYAEDWPVHNGDVYQILWGGDTAPRMVMDVRGGSHENGTSVIGYDAWPAHANQLWRAERAGQDGGGTYWYFRNLNSGRVLDVRGGDRDAGVDQWQFQSSGNQQWYVRRNPGNGNFAILVSRSTGQVINFTGREQELQMGDLQNDQSPNRQWMLYDNGPLWPKELRAQGTS